MEPWDVVTLIAHFRSLDVYWNPQTSWRILEPSDIVTSYLSEEEEKLRCLQEFLNSVMQLKPSDVVTSCLSNWTFRSCDVFTFLMSVMRLEPSDVVTSCLSTGTFGRRYVLAFNWNLRTSLRLGFQLEPSDVVTSWLSNLMYAALPQNKHIFFRQVRFLTHR